MPRRRDEAEAFALSKVAKIDVSGENTRLLKEQFHAMNDKQFDEWIADCRKGIDFIPIVLPNLSGHGVTTENNIKVARELGIELLQRLWITDETTGRRFLSVEKYLLLPLPVTRQIQTLVDGFTVPDHNRSVDDLTDQPVGDSKGAGVSGPELLIMAASELDQVILECIKVRGGDAEAMRQADRSIIETGHATIAAAMALDSRAKATDTLKKFFTGCHFHSTF